MNKKQLTEFLNKKREKLSNEEKDYLDEELRALNVQYGDFDKILKLEKMDSNPENILLYYLLDLAPYPDKLRHHWQLADMCDIDLDFSPSGRDSIKAWLKEKFGKDNCVSIGTYGTLGVKGSVQEISRVYGISPFAYLKISKLVSDDDKDLSEKEIREKYPEVDSFLNKHPEVARSLTKLTGMKKNVGCIAEGMLIDNKYPIESLVDKIVEISFIDNANEIKKTNKWLFINSGKKKCIRLDFDDGTFLECTPDHRVLTKNRGYVEADNLTEEDEIVSADL